jgi:hypothetical protein
MLSFYNALSNYIVEAGLITDELESSTTGIGAGSILSNGTAVSNPLDERILSLSSGQLDGSLSYGLLQGTRGFTSQAIGMLATYDTSAADLTSQKIMRAELYALTGYSEIMLADLFCSGVPLSTLDFQRDFTYKAGSTKEEVYRAAVAKFDTALMLADTSTQIRNLARVGQGRARLNLGQYQAAADDVQSVPDGFNYQLSRGVNIQSSNYWRVGCAELGKFNVDDNSGLNCTATISNREGGHGLPFISSGDPRSAGTPTFLNIKTDSTMLFPVKYQGYLTASTLTITVASGVEARLIQAEGALHGGDATTWLTILKTLHDTIPSLAALTDPGLSSPKPDSARVALQFQERAEWLYLTGSRQGDMRRLLRQYGQYWTNPDRLYPSGVYFALGAGRYGPDVTANIPASESVNPLFHGCLNRAP